MKPVRGKERLVEDGYCEAVKCWRPDCDLQVVRPGKFQCSGEPGGCPRNEAEWREFTESVNL